MSACWAEINSDRVVMEAKYSSRVLGIATTGMNVGGGVVGLIGVSVRIRGPMYMFVICMAVMYEVVFCVLARRKRVKTMKMGVKNMVAVGLR